MKTTVGILAAAAFFSATAFPSLVGAAPAEPSVIPAKGGEDASTAISPRGQEKHYQEITAETEQLDHDAAADLHAGQYAQAEAEARQSLSLRAGDIAEEVLAASLEAQGKDQEALQQYHVMVIDQKAGYPRVLLPYAQYLLKSGQWAQAAAVYNQALPLLGNGELEKETSHFSPDVPEPLALETAIHLERGQIYNGTFGWAGDTQNVEAMGEYTKALRLAPDNALTNYFYGVGWQKLSPTERTKFGTVQQAKAHLRKAEKVGNANIRAAAKKALKALG